MIAKNLRENRLRLHNRIKTAILLAENTVIDAKERYRQTEENLAELKIQLERVANAPEPPDGCPVCFTKSGVHVQLRPDELPKGSREPTYVDWFRCTQCGDLFKVTPLHMRP